MTNQKLIDAIALFDKDIFANSPNQLRLIIEAARENEQLRKERDELAMALKEYYIMYGDRSIISSVDDLLEKAGILND